MLELSDYQISAKDFLLSQTFAGLFDEAGTGKTAPAIMAGWSRHLATGLPVLITSPAYLKSNWQWEISRFIPGATVTVVEGNGPSARHAALQADTDFVIVGYYEWSARSSGVYTFGELITREWGAIIADEAHRFRGRNSQCTKHFFELRRAKSPNLKTPIWVLTGTPMPNNPGDFYPLLHLWDKKNYKSYWNFVGTYCHVIKTPWSTEVGQLRKGMEDDFQELIGKFSMRRTLADIPSLQSLEKRDREYFVTLPASVNTTIRKAREEYVLEHEDMEKSEFVSGGGALYAKLRQMATNPPTAEKPKIDFVRDFLEDHAGPVAVYCWYRGSATAVAEGLAKTGRPVTLISGDVPADKRAGLVATWSKQSDGILVATISSLREGISLIHSQDVILLESSELSSDMEQVVARFKRRGQQGLVNVHWVWAKNTPDVAIRRAVREREVGLKRALTTWLRDGT